MLHKVSKHCAETRQQHILPSVHLYRIQMEERLQEALEPRGSNTMPILLDARTPRCLPAAGLELPTEN